MCKRHKWIIDKEESGEVCLIHHCHKHIMVFKCKRCGIIKPFYSLLAISRCLKCLPNGYTG